MSLNFRCGIDRKTIKINKGVNSSHAMINNTTAYVTDS